MHSSHSPSTSMDYARVRALMQERSVLTILASHVPRLVLGLRTASAMAPGAYIGRPPSPSSRRGLRALKGREASNKAR